MFLRTYRCNLTCTWCDTKYTWYGQDRARPGSDYTPMSVGEVRKRVVGFGCKHLVVTGGEPLLHQRSLAPLVGDLKAEGFFIEVETNGTIAPSPELVAAVDCFNVSPKISNSMVGEGARFRPDALRAFVATENAWFKFVVCEEKDIAEVEGMLAAVGIPRDRAMLMPEGTDAPTVLARSRWLVEACKRRGFRYTPRLQILLFGNKRGT